MHVLIIGSGPAGISAAIYARRAGAEVTVAAHGTGALARAELVENYYGFAAPIPGTELVQKGIAGAKRLGVVCEEDEIVGIQLMDTGAGFLAEGIRRAYEADAVIIAAGAQRRSISVPGIAAYEGRGVSYCAICDAFFYRGKNVAVIGAGEYALHEAQILLPHAAQVTMLTNGAALSAKPTDPISVVSKKIARIEGDCRVRQIIFADDTQMDADGIFVAIGTAGSLELARKLGVLLRDGAIDVGEHMETNVPGIYAAGDCTGGLLQIAKAVYEGAEAGLSAVRYLRKT